MLRPPLNQPTKSPAVSAPETSKRLGRAETQALWRRASEFEQRRYFEASRDRQPTMVFDPTSQITPREQAYLVRQLAQSAAARPESGKPAKVLFSVTPTKPRRLTILEIARIRSRLIDSVPEPTAVTELLRQVVWAVEEGTLSRFPPALAVNTALKKIRERAWSRPNRLPPQWMLRQPLRAGIETCGVA